MAYTDIHKQNKLIMLEEKKSDYFAGFNGKIKLIENWSNKTDTLRHRIQRTAGEVLEPANNSLIDSR
jgi:hypothetical protein